MKSTFSYGFSYDFSYGGHRTVAVSLNLLRPSRPATRLRKVPQARDHIEVKGPFGIVGPL